MIVLYILLCLLGVLLALILAAVIRTLLLPARTSIWQPVSDPSRETEYAEKLSKMVRYETVSRKGEIQRDK